MGLIKIPGTGELAGGGGGGGGVPGPWALEWAEMRGPGTGNFGGPMAVTWAPNKDYALAIGIFDAPPAPGSVSLPDITLDRCWLPDNVTTPFNPATGDLEANLQITADDGVTNLVFDEERFSVVGAFGRDAGYRLFKRGSHSSVSGDPFSAMTYYHVGGGFEIANMVVEPQGDGSLDFQIINYAGLAGLNQSAMFAVLSREYA